MTRAGNVVALYKSMAAGRSEPVDVQVEAINTDLGTAYTSGDLDRWEEGSVSIPLPVLGWLRRATIVYAIRRAGGIPPESDEDADWLADVMGAPALK